MRLESEIHQPVMAHIRDELRAAAGMKLHVSGLQLLARFPGGRFKKIERRLCNLFTTIRVRHQEQRLTPVFEDAALENRRAWIGDDGDQLPVFVLREEGADAERRAPVKVGL